MNRKKNTQRNYEANNYSIDTDGVHPKMLKSVAF